MAAKSDSVGVVKRNCHENSLEGALAARLNSALNSACAIYSSSVALSGVQLELTYARFAEEAERLCSALLDAGLVSNEPVHVNVSNHPLDLAALLGVWNAGGVVVPLHRSTPDIVAAKVMEKTGARFLVDMRPSGRDATTMVSVISANQRLNRQILQEAALIIFTSGSTGEPKGVVVSHDAFYGKIQQIDSLLKFQAGESVLLVLNITFSFGLWISLLTLLHGGRLVMKEKFDAGDFLQSLLEEQISRVGMVPTMMRVLFSNHELAMKIDEIASNGALQEILIGGESLGKSLATSIRQRFAGTRLVDIYGLTETLTCDFFSFPDDFAKYPGCIGRPSPNVQFRIMDSDGKPTIFGGVGELQIRSPYLMNGYLDDPHLTEAAFSDGWFKTGDLARTMDHEVVELMGRSKELISRGGNKVTPSEIEQSLCSHPDIAAAMAIGVSDAVLGERIHALLVLRTGAEVQLPAIKNFLQNKLEKFKQPDAYYILDALPLGRTGKADKGQFRVLIESGAVTPMLAAN